MPAATLLATNMYYVLGIILGLLCAAVGIMGVGLIGYQILSWLKLFRSKRAQLQFTAWAFAMPAGLIGAWIGYRLWAEMVI